MVGDIQQAQSTERDNLDLEDEWEGGLSYASQTHGFGNCISFCHSQSMAQSSKNTWGFKKMMGRKRSKELWEGKKGEFNFTNWIWGYVWYSRGNTQ